MNNNSTTKTNVAIFGNVKMLVLSALFVALSIVLGKYLAFNLGDSIRISFENLPVLMSGIFFGPVIGGAVGLIADVVGSLMVGYSINPFITVGAVCVGVVAGIVANIIKTKNVPFKVYPSVLIAHAVGSMIVKSVGLYIFYSTPIPILLTRIPLYICIGCVEATLITLFLSNKEFANMLKKITAK